MQKNVGDRATFSEGSYLDFGALASLSEDFSLGLRTQMSHLENNFYHVDRISSGLAMKFQLIKNMNLFHSLMRFEESRLANVSGSVDEVYKGYALSAGIEKIYNIFSNLNYSWGCTFKVLRGRNESGGSVLKAFQRSMYLSLQMDME